MGIGHYQGVKIRPCGCGIFKAKRKCFSWRDLKAKYPPWRFPPTDVVPFLAGAAMRPKMEYRLSTKAGPATSWIATYTCGICKRVLNFVACKDTRISLPVLGFRRMGA